MDQPQYSVGQISAWQAEYIERRASAGTTPSPLVSSLSQPAPMAVLNSAVSGEGKKGEEEDEQGPDVWLGRMFAEEVAKWRNEDLYHQ